MALSEAEERMWDDIIRKSFLELEEKEKKVKKVRTK